MWCSQAPVAPAHNITAPSSLANSTSTPSCFLLPDSPYLSIGRSPSHVHYPAASAIDSLHL
ncbi:hypothetical protein K491DRAFT_296512 [Lophiostoma macrostomum CBS 122681]|uniref:Uncharacterized protein n=1 Tax=Lophiostoma macrostomum CBS 122681 TaxID=1314788 RepID=A0A6A6TFC0_9PLEO|nr:hypothetical protein K491DRAFT_296512 [Lophiostoma macrostomum CBS 122681]